MRKGKMAMLIRRLNMCMPSDPTIALLGFYSEEIVKECENVCATMFVAVLYVI